MMNSRRYGAAALLLAITLQACNNSAAEESSTGNEGAVATRGDLMVTAEAAGQIEPIRVVEVKSKASGEVLEIMVETGDVVQAGQLLARVDPRDVRNAFEQAEADLAVAQARLATAEAQKRRAAELRQANVVTEQEFESAALEEANGRAQFVKAQTNLMLARERMNDVTIRAPLTGTIIARTVQPGQIIQSASANISGGTTLLTMADLNVMQVRALIDETDLGRIQPGLGVRVSVEAYPERAFQGQVMKIEPQAVVDQNVTMFPVLVQLDNSEGLLRPGMNADVEVQIAERRDVIMVPNSAVASAREAVAAAGVLGVSEEAVRTALRGDRDTAVAARTPGDSGATDPSAAPADPAQECMALLQRVRAAGGPQGLSEADRTKMRSCREQLGSARRGSAQTRTSPGTPRPGMVFIDNAGTIEPRRVMLGVNDWDNTEIVSGLEEGERVVLISVARLQQQAQDFQNRMRERAGGVFPGGTGGRR